MAALYNNFSDFFLKYNLIIFYGTLLGIIRNNDFIENDDDIDLLLNISDLNNFLNDLDEKNVVYRKHIKKNEIPVIQCFYENIGPIDIYVYNEYKNDDILIKWDGGQLYAKKDIFPLKEIIFYDKKCLIPNNSEEILRQIYGKDWMIPTSKKYKWKDMTEVRFA